MLQQRWLSPSLQEGLLPSQRGDKCCRIMLRAPWFVHCPSPPPWLYQRETLSPPCLSLQKRRQRFLQGNVMVLPLPTSEKRMKSDPSTSFDSEARKNNAPFDNGHNDKEADFVPISDKAIDNIMDGKIWEDDYGLTEQHRKAFYLKAFPPSNPHKFYDRPQSKSASIPQCRPQTEVDYIKYVVQNWQKGPLIRTMQEGHEKNALLHFRRSHKLGMLRRSGLQETLNHVKC
jgi:hypothetical protein